MNRTVVDFSLSFVIAVIFTTPQIDVSLSKSNE